MNEIKKLFSFNSIVRDKSKRQYYFPIPKAYVDDGYIYNKRRYKIYIELLPETDKSEKVD